MGNMNKTMENIINSNNDLNKWIEKQMKINQITREEIKFIK